MKTCSDCLFYKVTKEITKGSCHYNPPSAAMINTPQGPNVISFRPIVEMKDMSCAHYRSKDFDFDTVST